MAHPIQLSASSRHQNGRGITGGAFMCASFCSLTDAGDIGAHVDQVDVILSRVHGRGPVLYWSWRARPTIQLGTSGAIMLVIFTPLPLRF